MNMASSSGPSKSKRFKNTENLESNEDNTAMESNSTENAELQEKFLKMEDFRVDTMKECEATSENEASNNPSAELNNSSRVESASNDHLQASNESFNDTESSNLANAQDCESSSSDAESNNYSSDSPINYIRDSDDLWDASCTPEMIEKYDPTPKTPYPKHTWSVVKAVASHQYGYGSKYSPDLFRYNCYSSLHVVERLELMYKMEGHDGCVNALNFNAAGTKLASGSDDLNVIIWNWLANVPLLTYHSGHHTNIFQAKWLPQCNDSQIVTVARDGQVRIGEIQPDGSVQTRRLAKHILPAHKLATQDSPHIFLSCGEDSRVNLFDLREGDAPINFLDCFNGLKKMPLFSIHSSPLKSHEFVVAGKSSFVKIFDQRYIGKGEQSACLKQFCPSHMVNSTNKNINVTCAVYNYNGEEIIASYNDDDIYLFDAQKGSLNEYLHKYGGHVNKQTIKGVNYFGPKSEYIVSGSDCGYIFFWEKQSEHIVKYMHGDECGMVNCLEPHPTIPVIATSGIDDDIKIWVPSKDDPPDMSALQSHLVKNMKRREEERGGSEAFFNRTVMFLMNHLAYFSEEGEPGDSPGVEPDSTDDSSVSSSEWDDLETCNLF